MRVGAFTPDDCLLGLSRPVNLLRKCPMSYLRNGLLALILSTSLTMGACNNKDKAETPKISEKPTEITKALSTKKLSAKSFEPYLKVDKRDVSEVDSRKALARMGLWNANKSPFAWESKSDKGGKHIYKNLSATGDDGEDIQIDSLEITGAHMVGSEPSFDRMDMYGLSVTSEDGTAKVARLSMARPSPKFGSAIMKGIQKMDDLKDLTDLDIDVDLEDGDMAFGAMLMDDLQVTADNADIKLTTVAWGEDEDTQKGAFLLKDLNVDGVDEDSGHPVKITLDSISTTGLNMKYFRALGQLDKAGDNPLVGLNPYASQFDSFSLKNFNLNADVLSVSTDGVEAMSRQKGKVTTTQQNLKPISIKFSEAPKSPEPKQAYDALKAAGFEELVFSGASTTVMNENTDTISVNDAWFKLDDGFRLQYDYEGTGATAMINGLQHADGEDLSDTELKAVLEKMTLKSLNLKLTDDSLVDKVMNIVAQQQGVSPKLVRLQAKSGLMVLGIMAQNEAQAELMGDLSSSLGKFLDDGGTLNINLNPETPVPASLFMDIKDPTEIDPKQFGISVSHSQ